MSWIFDLPQYNGKRLRRRRQPRKKNRFEIKKKKITHSVRIVRLPSPIHTRVDKTYGIENGKENMVKKVNYKSKKRNLLIHSCTFKYITFWSAVNQRHIGDEKRKKECAPRLTGGEHTCSRVCVCVCAFLSFLFNDDCASCSSSTAIYCRCHTFTGMEVYGLAIRFYSICGEYENDVGVVAMAIAVCRCRPPRLFLFFYF